MALTKVEKEELRAGWRSYDEKWDRYLSEKATARSDRIQRAMEERIEKRDSKAVDRWLRAWERNDRKELRKWEKEFAKI